MSTLNHDTELEEIDEMLLLALMKADITPGTGLIGYNIKLPDDALNNLKVTLHTYLYKQTLELIKNNVAYPELKNMIDADKLRKATAERWGQE
jgi:hypothetical protein